MVNRTPTPNTAVSRRKVLPGYGVGAVLPPCARRAGGRTSKQARPCLNTAGPSGPGPP